MPRGQGQASFTPAICALMGSCSCRHCHCHAAHLASSLRYRSHQATFSAIHTATMLQVDSGALMATRRCSLAPRYRGHWSGLQGVGGTRLPRRPLWPSPKNVRKHNLPLPASRRGLVVGGEQAGIPRGPRFCLRTSSLASLGFGDGPESGYAGTEPAQHMENLDVHEEPRQC
jgi:hypothetical protein